MAVSPSNGSHPARFVGGAFEQAQRGRADRDDPAAGGAGGVEPLGRLGRDPAPFGVHDMVVGVVGLDRQEGAGADMEGQDFVADAGFGERRHQGRREMERGGRRRDRPFLAREHGLIIVAVARVGGAPAGDIRRQRHPPCLFEQQLDRLLAFEGQQERAVRGPLARQRGDAGAEIDPVAVAQPPGVADEGAPGARPLALVQSGADPGLAPSAFELGGDDARVVEHQHVAAPKQGRQILHIVIGDGAAFDPEQPRRVARVRRPQRDPIGGKVEIEEVDAHAAGRRP